MGHYVAARVLWDVGEAGRLDGLVEDFLDKAFGTAKEPMREFYRLINFDTQRRRSSDLLGRMYRQLDAARRASADPAVLTRVGHLTLFARHAELYDSYANGGGGATAEDVARHAYRMRKSMMVHSYGLWARLIGQQAADTPGHSLKSEEAYSAEELAKLLAEGIARNVPSDPGFASVEFGRKLVPAAASLKLPDVPTGTFPTASQDRQQYHIWVPEGTGEVGLKVTVQKVWALQQPRVSLFSPMEVTSNAVAIEASYAPDGRTYDVSLKTPHPGLHRVETVDGGDHTRIEWPSGMPVRIESGINTPGATSHFRGAWTMYFTCPRGRNRSAGGHRGSPTGRLASRASCSTPTAGRCSTSPRPRKAGSMSRSPRGRTGDSGSSRTARVSGS